MSDQNGTDSTPAANGRRRGSFATLMAMFDARSPPGNGSGSPPSANSGSYPGPITQAAGQAAQRRLSVATTGLGTSPSQPSPFDNLRSRGQSISGSSSGSVEESPFEDNDGPPVGSMPQSPFARRVSFGAQAMRDMKRSGSGSSAGGGNQNDGFNFAENMRARAERGSMSGAMPTSPSAHGRAKSVAVMEPPVREMPAQPRKPDHFQERILKGDFYMD